MEECDKCGKKKRDLFVCPECELALCEDCLAEGDGVTCKDCLEALKDPMLTTINEYAEAERDYRAALIKSITVKTGELTACLNRYGKRFLIDNENESTIWDTELIEGEECDVRVATLSWDWKDGDATVRFVHHNRRLKFLLVDGVLSVNGEYSYNVNPTYRPVRPVPEGGDKWRVRMGDLEKMAELLDNLFPILRKAIIELRLKTKLINESLKGV